MLKKNMRGFTLLELLVVISIIGILIAISAAAFTNAQQKARNAKRQGDVSAMSKAFEQYYSINASSYGANCTAMAGSMSGGSLPTDPKGGWTSYSCTSTGGVTNTYCVCARLEPAGNTDGNSGAACSGLGSAGEYFCLVQQQ